MKDSFWSMRVIFLHALALFVVCGNVQITEAAAKKSCSCVFQWIQRAGVSTVSAKKYEKIINSLGLPIAQIGKMNPVVFGIVLHGNIKDARKIQQCLKGLSWKCRSYNPCQKGGLCNPGRRGKPSTCTCAKGLTGCLCKTDIDECQSRKLNKCDHPSRATCGNTWGSYMCDCRKGYTGNGRKCVDADECKKKTDKCHKQARCMNTIGSYRCKCKPPFRGDGLKCSRDLCGYDKKNPVCREVKLLRVHVGTLQKKLSQQYHQTRLLTNVITHFLTRTAKLDKRLTVESGRVTSLKNDLTKMHQQRKCPGILSWKHFSKRTSSTFKWWQVTFNKKRKDSSLRVTYSGLLGVQGYNHNHWYCTRIKILFNGRPCSNPGAITSGYVFRKDNGNWWTYSMAPSMVTGHCNGLSSGSVRVQVQITNACSSSNYGNHNGYSPFGTTSYSLNVEEYCA